jgi:hypothetical protein
MILEKYWGGPGIPFVVLSAVLREVDGGLFCVETWFSSVDASNSELRRYLCSSIESARNLLEAMLFSPDHDNFTSDRDIAWLLAQPLPAMSGEQALIDRPWEQKNGKRSAEPPC